jgi:putative membrane protein
VDQISSWSEKRVYSTLVGCVVMNLILFIFLAWQILPVDPITIRITGGFFLLIFVCLHGWYRYGWDKMVLFFSVTAAIAWLAESLSIETGIPFGQFYYNDTLGEKIGSVPIMIIPAYIFNGYLAWTMSGLFAGNRKGALQKKQAVLVPVIAALIMVIWNISFESVMSAAEGHWIWPAGGPFYGVPLSNFLGWFATAYLIFQIFALLLLRQGGRQSIAIRPAHWYLFPLMYAVQGLPSILYPLFRSEHPALYRTAALLTIGGMYAVAFANLCVIRHNIARDPV